MHLKRNEFKLKPNRLIDWKKVSILSCCCCCCLILLLLGEFGLNTQYLLLEVNWLGFCNSVFFCFLFYLSLHLLVVVCCDTVVSIYSAYCLLLFVYWFVLLCLIWRQKQNLLNICLCMYLWTVCLYVEKGKMLLWQTKDQTKLENFKC